MKKMICALLALLMIAALAGCSTTKNIPAESDQKTDVILTDSKKENRSIDVDLTKLSSTMRYSEVYNMMMKPSDYMGKTVKMNGYFSFYHDESTDKYYFACIIADATACCSQGIEFELTGEHKYPEDYPEVGTEITVEGEFSTYMEGTLQYCYLINATME